MYKSNTFFDKKNIIFSTIHFYTRIANKKKRQKKSIISQKMQIFHFFFRTLQNVFIIIVLMDKKELRQIIRSRKKAFSQEELAEKSVLILKKLEGHLLFQNAQNVMLYASLPDEVQTMDFIKKWQSRKKIILPTIVGDDIVPVELTTESNMKIGDFNILEPENQPYNEDIDIIVIPGMAFDKAGHRLGRGKGFYDRFLAKHPTTKTIGLCFDFQIMENIPIEAHDKPVDEVLF